MMNSLDACSLRLYFATSPGSCFFISHYPNLHFDYLCLKHNAHPAVEYICTYILLVFCLDKELSMKKKII